jgi:hypothetical protein
MGLDFTYIKIYISKQYMIYTLEDLSTIGMLFLSLNISNIYYKSLFKDRFYYIMKGKSGIFEKRILKSFLHM